MVRSLLVGHLILVTWTGIDYVLHFSFLSPFYNENPSLWRPNSEMNVGLIFLVRVVLTATFMASYSWYVNPKSVRSGTLFGVLIGVQLGVGVGLGTYIHIAVPAALAAGWVFGAVVKSTIAGVVVGALLRPGEHG